MTESTRSKYTDHNIEKSNTHHPYCLICGTDIENHPTETFPTNDEIQFDCPNCADQASIAAPGEITLCKTHDNERHYKLMKDFFIEEIQQLQFKAISPFCSCCGTDKKVCYVGMIPVYKTDQISVFSFCINCRDELTLKKNAAIAAQERIGA